jgi:hypothetical protein
MIVYQSVIGDSDSCAVSDSGLVVLLSSVFFCDYTFNF